jgi:hypothetical protein
VVSSAPDGADYRGHSRRLSGICGIRYVIVFKKALWWRGLLTPAVITTTGQARWGTEELGQQLSDRPQRGEEERPRRAGSVGAVPWDTRLGWSAQACGDELFAGACNDEQHDPRGPWTTRSRRARHCASSASLMALA